MERRKLSESTEHSMTVRIVTSAVFALITVPCAILGGWFLFALSLLVVGFATYEILSMPGKGKFNVGIWIVTFLAAFVMTYWQFIADSDVRDALFSGNNFSLGIENFQVSIIAAVIYLLVLFIFCFLSENVKVADVFYLFGMVLLVSLGFFSVLFLRYNPVQYYDPIWSGFIPDLKSCLLMWWVLFGVWMSDIGAYFFGVFFGRHPMNARISPHKTWEGFVGGCAVSLVFSFTYVAVVNVACGVPMIPGVLDMVETPAHWGYVVLFALLFPILDNVGGFMFSAIKRHYEAKDWGRLLPGHGGILDRFDGVIVTSIVSSIIIVLTTGGWSFMF